MIGHIQNVLAQVLFPLMTCYKIYSTRATVPENQKVAPEEKWVHGGSIEVP